MLFSLGGCVSTEDGDVGGTGSDGTDGDNEGGDENNRTENQSGNTLENYVELSDHHFEEPPMADGVDMYHTYQNVSQQEISRIQFGCELFVDNERVGQGSNSVYDLGAGIEETDSMYLNGATRLDEVTHYTITVNARVNREEYEETYEFEEFQYQ